MDYNFREIEERWQKFWAENKSFAAEEKSEKPKYYVLDMFPYPSGAGLHVGHPLGYIASDIYARYKRHKGFNVLHPMGFDSFGLPAEQYAIQTGQHPNITTKENIQTYKRQLNQLGFSFDWDREVRTSDLDYYKWTQWIFIQIFNSWYNKKRDRAESIDSLIAEFEKNGNIEVEAHSSFEGSFSAKEWKTYSEKEKSEILMHYRLSYLADSYVNWCPALGTVLANDEVKDGLSERGGHPVERKKMKQWSMRITAYVERLLSGLDKIEWSDALKEIQRNWIGKSEGASIEFELINSKENIDVFTTRPDTIFGVSFMVLAPEHELVGKITTTEQKKQVEEYVEMASNRSERDRLTEVKRVSGVFTGAYVLHPFTNEKIPVWIGDYVLASYGTGAVMAVPSGDQRDWDFATHFKLPIPAVIEGQDVSVGADDRKEGKLVNSDFLNGLSVKEAIKKSIAAIEEKEIGKGKTNYRLRDAVFSRQRYWGEPIPIYYEDGIAKPMDEELLPLRLPEVDKYLPTEDGEPPLARAENWNTKEGHPIESSTMPGWAGSSWYLFRYMSPNFEKAFAATEQMEYWENVDIYFGGAEHATGHLLYSRFWTKFLFDRGFLKVNEPFQKLINQGMILGNSRFVYRLFNSIDFPDYAKEIENFKILPANEITQVYISADARNILESKNYTPEKQKLLNRINELSKDETKRLQIKYPDYLGKVVYYKSTLKAHVNVKYVDGVELDFIKLSKEETSYKNAKFITNNIGKYICGSEVEKMSKSKFNVVNPDQIIKRYGADTLRLYEMFLGPLELPKPWDTDGIEGVHRFLRKLFRLYHDKENNFEVSEEKANKDELKALHKCIKKLNEDIERFSFNTGVSSFMICVNELTDLKCNKREILQPLSVLLAPYAPHVAEELWAKLGNEKGIGSAEYPMHKEEYLKESSHKYPISFNGKMRFTLEMDLNLSKEEIQEKVLKSEEAQKWLENKQPKKVIVVPGKIVNVVV